MAGSRGPERSVEPHEEERLQRAHPGGLGLADGAGGVGQALGPLLPLPLRGDREQEGRRLQPGARGRGLEAHAAVAQFLGGGFP